MVFQRLNIVTLHFVSYIIITLTVFCITCVAVIITFAVTNMKTENHHQHHFAYCFLLLLQGQIKENQCKVNIGKSCTFAWKSCPIKLSARIQWTLHAAFTWSNKKKVGDTDYSFPISAQASGYAEERCAKLECRILKIKQYHNSSQYT